MPRNRFALRARASQKYVLVLLVMANCAYGQSAQSSTTSNYICSAGAVEPGANGAAVLYLTDIFPASRQDGAYVVSEGTMKVRLEANFSAYLTATKGVRVDVSCVRPRPGETFDSYAAKREAFNREQHNAAPASFPIARTVRVDWRYDPAHDYTRGPTAPASNSVPANTAGMPPQIRQLIDAEASKAEQAPCKSGELSGYYGKKNFDCSCFAQKLRDYRTKEYEEGGGTMVSDGVGQPQHPKMVSPYTGHMALPTLDPPLVMLILHRENPTVDFRSCALPDNASSLSGDAESVSSVPASPVMARPAPVRSGPVSAPPRAHSAGAGQQSGTVSSSIPGATAPSSARAAVVGFCWADADPQVAYYSAPFDAANAGYAEWMSAFQSFLTGKYGYKRFVRCDHKTSMVEAAKFLAVEKSYSTQHRQRIVETAWKYK